MNCLQRKTVTYYYYLLRSRSTMGWMIGGYWLQLGETGGNWCILLRLYKISFLKSPPEPRTVPGRYSLSVWVG